MEKVVNVIGAGLAGTECAYKLANNGIKVRLYEMKPNKKSEAHSSNDFAGQKLTHWINLFGEPIRSIRPKRWIRRTGFQCMS